MKKINENSINKFIFGAGLFWGAFAVFASAAEVMLKEGKVITGVITEEDEQEITMLLGHKMVLHVDKSKIESIKRDPAPTPIPNRNAPPLPPPVKPKNAAAGDEAKQTVLDNVTLIQVKRTALSPVIKEKAPDFSALTSRIDFEGHWNGEPSKEGAEVKWKSLVVAATTTSTLPAWEPTGSVPEDLAKAWDERLADLTQRLVGHADIYSDMLKAAGPNLMSLRGASEADLKAKSERAWKDLLYRAENRRRGLVRRERNRPPTASPVKSK